jgi:hypothetical protein
LHRRRLFTRDSLRATNRVSHAQRWVSNSLLPASRILHLNTARSTADYPTENPAVLAACNTDTPSEPPAGPAGSCSSDHPMHRSNNRGNPAQADRSTYSSSRVRSTGNVVLAPGNVPAFGLRTNNRGRPYIHADDDTPCCPNEANCKPNNHTDQDGTPAHTPIRSTDRSNNRCRPPRSIRRDCRRDHTYRSTPVPSAAPRRPTTGGMIRIPLHRKIRSRVRNNHCMAPRIPDTGPWLGSRQARLPARARLACVSSFPPKDPISRLRNEKKTPARGEVDTTGIGGITGRIQQKDAGCGVLSSLPPCSPHPASSRLS